MDTRYYSIRSIYVTSFGRLRSDVRRADYGISVSINNNRRYCYVTKWIHLHSTGCDFKEVSLTRYCMPNFRKNTNATERKKPPDRYSDWHLTLVRSESHSTIRGECPRLSDLPMILTYSTQWKMSYCAQKA